MKLNRILICGTNSFSQYLLIKLINMGNIITLYDYSNDLNDNIKYNENNKVIDINIKRINELEQYDEYDYIIISDTDIFEYIDIINKNISKKIYIIQAINNLYTSKEMNEIKNRLNKDLVYTFINVGTIIINNTLHEVSNYFLDSKIYVDGETDKESVLKNIGEIIFTKDIYDFLDYVKAHFIPIYFLTKILNGRIYRLNKYQIKIMLCAINELLISIKRRSKNNEYINFGKYNKYFIKTLYIRYLKNNTLVLNYAKDILNNDIRFSKVINEFLVKYKDENICKNLIKLELILKNIKE